MRLVGVYGAGGHGREVMPLLRGQADSETTLVFIDDAHAGSSVNGCPVLDWSGFLSRPCTQRLAVLAMGDSRARERLARRLAEAEVGLLGVRAANAVIMDDVQIGAGEILSPFVLITSNIRIGRCFHANAHSHVAHDCVIGDFVTFAPGVRCNGNVVIEDHAYVGAGAILRNGTPGRPLVVGRGAVVGMGAVVTRDVPPGVTVAGNPARPMDRTRTC